MRYRFETVLVAVLGCALLAAAWGLMLYTRGGYPPVYRVTVSPAPAPVAVTVTREVIDLTNAGNLAAARGDYLRARVCFDMAAAAARRGNTPELRAAVSQIEVTIAAIDARLRAEDAARLAARPVAVAATQPAAVSASETRPASKLFTDLGD